VIGKTGSGKSTFLDLLLALLTPSEGKLLVDGLEINNQNCSGWYKNIAHVPQSIILTDETIAKNIAFGETEEEIDYNKIYRACRQSHIYDEINSLENKFQTIVGENGTRLSGGQKQRIGIARALYKNADVLILDEATSALDVETEKNIINQIKKIKKNITVIMVTHRLLTLENCNVIYEIKNNTIKGINLN